MQQECGITSHSGRVRLRRIACGDRHANRASDMEYAFDKHRLPKGQSFPLKRSVLDTHLDVARLKTVWIVYYWVRNAGSVVLRADYCGEGRKGWATAGRTTLTVYAVPSGERKETEIIVVRDILPKLVAWLRKAEDSGNTWRGADHEIVFNLEDGALRIEER
jgi:hypothetical protein